MPETLEKLHLEFDDDGLLKDPAQWSEAAAESIASIAW